jgi:transcriptional regulator with XRE-family HTH domain
VARQRNEAVALGRVIARLRGDLEYSRPDLAKVAGLSYPYLYEIEKGTKYPAGEALEKIAAALELLPKDLIALQAELEETLTAEPEGAAPPRAASNLTSIPRSAPAAAGEVTSKDMISVITQQILEHLEPAVRTAVARALKDST